MENYSLILDTLEHNKGVAILKYDVTGKYSLSTCQTKAKIMTSWEGPF